MRMAKQKERKKLHESQNLMEKTAKARMRAA